MRAQYGTWAALALARAVAGAPATPTEPCALASAAAESYLSAAGPKETIALIRPSLALNCLLSVPVDEPRDLELLDYLEPYVEWQSTLEPLANPPEGYLIPGVDVLAGLGQIRAKLSKSEYTTQAEFASDLAYLFIQASDGHFGYSPAIFKVFQFTGTNGIVSLSSDGVELPKVYLQSDVAQSIGESWVPSEIESIDDVPIVTYLEMLSARQGLQDPDAKYNTLFTNRASDAVGTGDFFVGGRYAGTRDEELFQFANGSTLIVKNLAAVSVGALPGLVSGETFHEAFEVPAAKNSARSTPTVPERADSTIQERAETIKGYPVPVEKHKHDWIAGYFMEEQGYEDTAVLAILSFAPYDIPLDDIDGLEELVEAQRTVKDFLIAAKKAGKTKLIIDVSANGGGLVMAGFDVYAQLFPGSDIWDGNRIRANAALDALGDTAYDTPIFADFIGTDMDRDHKKFPNWDSIYGPETVEGQNATRLMRYDFTDDAVSQGFAITGFDPRNPPAFKKPPFAAENIVVVTDGFCASTCTIFTGLLNREQGVRTIALGGRPLEAPMQAIGGVKGAQVLKYSELRMVVIKIAQDAVAARNTTRLDQSIDDLPSFGEPPLLPPLSQAGAFNYRNAYTRTEPDGNSVHFVYEAANCRLFYTPEMVFSVEKVWSRAADAAFHGAKCVAGSTVNKDGTIGDKSVPFTEAVNSDSPHYYGPGSLDYMGDYEPSSRKMRLARRESLEEKLKNGGDLEYKSPVRIGTSVEEMLEKADGVDYKSPARIGGSVEELLEKAEEMEYKAPVRVGMISRSN